MATINPTVSNSYVPKNERPISDRFNAFLSTSSTSFSTMLEITGAAGCLNVFKSMTANGGTPQITIDGVVVLSDSEITTNSSTLGGFIVNSNHDPEVDHTTSTSTQQFSKLYFNESIKLEVRSLGSATQFYAEGVVY